MKNLLLKFTQKYIHERYRYVEVLHTIKIKYVQIKFEEWGKKKKRKKLK